MYKIISWEAGSVIEDDIGSWKDNVLPSLLSEYSSEKEYTADVFGLFLKLMIDKPFVFKNETCHRGKMSKECVKVLAC